ncbi:uncharacterized protein MONOS_11746 [Monocercomonoides exilis]|uniref:uncharacterized protein n=1 Tax=Monocercomonoides exilis TaxID=2049356 RepID=UPI003559ACF7|nr:hypothetical protein MONOS_11746 [Monocercomonoides exilis]|eukprot:MONOS_11746.1-p1 / transcript=MONOS_11746.1 / gene=MONOS_11746 / organism=Monocercomonoides_exilis_PA203 / gene_product=unspecified product / transcript_product=unspecified product / location=Mono_scaffold00607:25354-28852(-) / protein_length=1144 / sequence_SO=supercontig / SO=protein_coding / is_pseudo=false
MQGEHEFIPPQPVTKKIKVSDIVVDSDGIKFNGVKQKVRFVFSDEKDEKEMNNLTSKQKNKKKERIDSEDAIAKMAFHAPPYPLSDKYRLLLFRLINSSLLPQPEKVFGKIKQTGKDLPISVPPVFPKHSLSKEHKKDENDAGRISESNLRDEKEKTDSDSEEPEIPIPYVLADTDTDKGKADSNLSIEALFTTSPSSIPPEDKRPLMMHPLLSSTAIRVLPDGQTLESTTEGSATSKASHSVMEGTWFFEVTILDNSLTNAKIDSEAAAGLEIDDDGTFRIPMNEAAAKKKSERMLKDDLELQTIEKEVLKAEGKTASNESMELEPFEIVLSTATRRDIASEFAPSAASSAFSSFHQSVPPLPHVRVGWAMDEAETEEVLGSDRFGYGLDDKNGWVMHDGRVVRVMNKGHRWGNTCSGEIDSLEDMNESKHESFHKESGEDGKQIENEKKEKEIEKGSEDDCGDGEGDKTQEITPSLLEQLTAPPPGFLWEDDKYLLSAQATVAPKQNSVCLPHYTPRPLLPGDVIGCLIHLPMIPERVQRREAELQALHYVITQTSSYYAEESKRPTIPVMGSFIAYYLNGESLGIGAVDIERGAYRPAVSIGAGARVMVNFGKNFRYPPDWPLLLKNVVVGKAMRREWEAMKEFAIKQAKLEEELHSSKSLRSSKGEESTVNTSAIEMKLLQPFLPQPTLPEEKSDDALRKQILLLIENGEVIIRPLLTAKRKMWMEETLAEQIGVNEDGSERFDFLPQAEDKNAGFSNSKSESIAFGDTTEQYVDKVSSALLFGKSTSSTIGTNERAKPDYLSLLPPLPDANPPLSVYTPSLVSLRSDIQKSLVQSFIKSTKRRTRAYYDTKRLMQMISSENQATPSMLMECRRGCYCLATTTHPNPLPYWTPAHSFSFQAKKEMVCQCDLCNYHRRNNSQSIRISPNTFLSHSPIEPSSLTSPLFSAQCSLSPRTSSPFRAFYTQPPLIPPSHPCHLPFSPAAIHSSSLHPHPLQTEETYLILSLLYRRPPLPRLLYWCSSVLSRRVPQVAASALPAAQSHSDTYRRIRSLGHSNHSSFGSISRRSQQGDKDRERKSPFLAGSGGISAASSSEASKKSSVSSGLLLYDDEEASWKKERKSRISAVKKMHSIAKGMLQN